MVWIGGIQNSSTWPLSGYSCTDGLSRRVWDLGGWKLVHRCRVTSVQVLGVSCALQLMTAAFSYIYLQTFVTPSTVQMDGLVTQVRFPSCIYLCCHPSREW